ncbi:Zn-ribbon domain-containing OB-fold protein [Nocardia jiangxiensis]|uniref:Zn-ribbon domain-containing OB-fold protein n=1 Tax=Nocardia jiangxiensis TaxID=282685 RepID=UPI0006850050|nr:OB-fold domain-containing protein [Nocardia jiangxiensis]
MTASRPIPVPDDLSADYWAAARRHVLSLPRCSRCDWFAFPPTETCMHCGTTTPMYRFEPVRGRGSVRSWTVVRNASLLGFADRVPYLLVDVELAEQPGLRMVAQLLEGPETVVHVDDPVLVTFEDIDEEFSIPAFTLAGGSTANRTTSPTPDGSIR